MNKNKKIKLKKITKIIIKKKKIIRIISNNSIEKIDMLKESKFKIQSLSIPKKYKNCK